MQLTVVNKSSNSEIFELPQNLFPATVTPLNRSLIDLIKP